MASAFKCDGCEDLSKGSPAASIQFQKNLTFDTAGFHPGTEIDLCENCIQDSLSSLFREIPIPAGSTYEQEASNGDREWKVDDVKCPNCGQRYPADYSRCEHCGTPNGGV